MSEIGTGENNYFYPWSTASRNEEKTVISKIINSLPTIKHASSMRAHINLVKKELFNYIFIRLFLSNQYLLSITCIISLINILQ